jgi:hypothetical protein
MTAHEEIRAWLALSAAGLLDPAEERRLREHVRECAGCAGELEALSALASGLRVQPAPAPSAELLARTAALAAAELAAEADRRRGAGLAIACGLAVWISSLFTWSVYEILTGGAAALLRPNLAGLLAWFAISIICTGVAAPAAVALTAARRRLERSFT